MMREHLYQQKENILFLLGILVSTEIKYLTHKIAFQNYISKLDLAIFLDFVREFYKFEEIINLNITLPQYAQRKIQEQALQWILL